ncbi:hypothetical protein KQ302_00005 [Synechococcus sp. CS-602]|nr:hypothetical protein [Synechococcus sp. CS-602]
METSSPLIHPQEERLFTDTHPTLLIRLGFSALLFTVIFGAIAVASVGSRPLQLQVLELPGDRPAVQGHNADR